MHVHIHIYIYVYMHMYTYMFVDTYFLSVIYAFVDLFWSLGQTCSTLAFYMRRERESSEEEIKSESYALFPLPDSEETFGIRHIFLTFS